jgi:hypothetical protein
MHLLFYLCYSFDSFSLLTMKTQSCFRLSTLTFFFIILLSSSLTQAQDLIQYRDEPKESLKDRIFWGGSLGLQFGSITLVDVSPIIGYKINKRVGVGLSPTYKYYSYKDSYTDQSAKTNVYGCGIFTRITIWESIFGHAEYEYLAYDNKVKSYQNSQYTYSSNFQSVLVGAGYKEAIADNAFMYLLVLWNLNETYDSPYTNPVIRVGFSVGF